MDTETTVLVFLLLAQFSARQTIFRVELCCIFSCVLKFLFDHLEKKIVQLLIMLSLTPLEGDYLVYYPVWNTFESESIPAGLQEDVGKPGGTA
jgi:hypothetical protein